MNKPSLKALFLFTAAVALVTVSCTQVRAEDMVEDRTVKTVHPRLNLTVKGIKKTTGSVVIEVFDSEDGFSDFKTSPFQKVIKKAEFQSVVQIFEDLEPGNYAIRVFHDTNGNGELDVNFLGLPTEPTGYSNKAKADPEPPPFEKAKFGLGQSEMTMEIQLK